MTTNTTTKAEDQGTREAQREQAAAIKVDQKIRKLAGDAENTMAQLNLLIAEVIERKTFVLLGFETWQAYVSDVTSKNMPQLAAVSRNALIKFLTAKGMSVRAVATALNTSAGTVSAVNNGSNTGAPENRKGGAPKGQAQVRRSPAVRLEDQVKEWQDNAAGSVKSTLPELKALRAQLAKALEHVDRTIAAREKAERDDAAAQAEKAERAARNAQGNNPRTGVAA